MEFKDLTMTVVLVVVGLIFYLLPTIISDKKKP